MKSFKKCFLFVVTPFKKVQFAKKSVIPVLELLVREEPIEKQKNNSTFAIIEQFCFFTIVCSANAIKNQKSVQSQKRLKLVIRVQHQMMRIGKKVS